MPPVRHRRAQALHEPNTHKVSSNFSRQKEKWFGCPYPKNRKTRYENVHNNCTHGPGFPTIRLLNEHLRKYHTCRFGCGICKKRFLTSSKETIEKDKAEHEIKGPCIPRELSIEESEWMNPEEEQGWAHRDQTKIDKYGEQLAYSTIYSSIFGDKMPASETPYCDYLIPKHLAFQSACGGNMPLSSYTLETQHQNIDWAIAKGTDSGFGSAGQDTSVPFEGEQSSMPSFIATSLEVKVSGMNGRCIGVNYSPNIPFDDLVYRSEDENPFNM